jgi:hypothetical protein
VVAGAKHFRQPAARRNAKRRPNVVQHCAAPDSKADRRPRAETKLLALGAVARVERVREELDLVLEIFEAMCPALPEHELTLSGWRKLDGSARKRLQAAGYNAQTTRRRAR